VGGSKILTVRSLSMLKNNTTIPLEFGVPDDSNVIRSCGVAGNDWQSLHVIECISEPGMKVSIPLELSEKPSIYVRPAEGNFDWNAAANSINVGALLDAFESADDDNYSYKVIHSLMLFKIDLI
jgi:hypothetical protein